MEQLKLGYPMDPNAGESQLFHAAVGVRARLTHNLDKERGFVNGAMAEMVLPPAPPNMAYKVEKLNPLAFPKGMDLRCELTGKPALVRPHGSKRPHARRPRSATGLGSARGEPRESHCHWRAAARVSRGRRAAGGPGRASPSN